MSIIDFKLPKYITKALGLPDNNPQRQQLKVLKKLLKKARFTKFGQHYHFDEIWIQKNPSERFIKDVPVFTYNKIYNEWWKETLEGVPDICWPGKIKYYALSSGTSEASSKYIPITNDLLKGNTNVMIRQLLSLRKYSDVPFTSVGRGWLSLGGSTELQKDNTFGYYAGDLSGITAKKSPFWFQPFYKPGKKIARERDWQKKLEEMVEKAPQWDIGFALGVPAWLQLLMEKIIERYKVETIHDIWPNFRFFVHGGVSFEPYRKGFEKFLGKPVTYIETYLASEGFLAYQDRQHPKGMRLVTNGHIYFEFIPFDDKNFDADGNLICNPQIIPINEVEENKDYAILISTPAGAWRYMIGDTIRFADKNRSEIIITGRTKHFLSLVGEHLSVDNMNKAIQEAQQELNIVIPEFTVAGKTEDTFFAHHWYIACDDEGVDTEALKTKIDTTLRAINDDYGVERDNALKYMHVTVLPENKFMEFMEKKGKIGGQHKFPRVLKGSMLEDWEAFVK